MSSDHLPCPHCLCHTASRLRSDLSALREENERLKANLSKMADQLAGRSEEHFQHLEEKMHLKDRLKESQAREAVFLRTIQATEAFLTMHPGDYEEMVNDALKTLRDVQSSPRSKAMIECISTLRKIAVAEDCEGVGEVLGGKLMNMAREALAALDGGGG